MTIKRRAPTAAPRCHPAGTMTLSAGYDCFRNGLSGRVDGLGGQNKQMEMVPGWVRSVKIRRSGFLAAAGHDWLCVLALPQSTLTTKAASQSILQSSRPRNVQNPTKYRVTVLGAPRQSHADRHSY
ncbi:hypothetical protein VTN00DRAFT_1196 [Thermoascus crustaceus]|uniref:uncharacterized protein n=1 Tax=Thermoascus crustaceus TaxID=5088 RepID=UPI0037448AE4